MSGSRPAGHVFICYSREDADKAATLQEALQAAGFSVWRDTSRLEPGDRWKMKIRHAISEEALAFVACFSQASIVRLSSYWNEELTLGIEELRQRRVDVPWFIPVRFDECNIPQLDIGGGQTLESIQRADFFGPRESIALASLVRRIQTILGSHEDSESTIQLETAPTPVPPPGPIQPEAGEHPPPPDGRRKRPPPPDGRRKRMVIIAAAIVTALCLIAAFMMVVIVPALSDHHSGPPTSSPTPAVPVKTQVPRGCPARVGGLDNNELAGFVTSSCFPAGSDMAKVASDIEAANAGLASGGTPYRTVVFFGVMTNSTDGSANPASLFQLRGVLEAQQRQNQGNPAFKVRVLLANAADQFQAGPVAAQLVSAKIRQDHSIVAVLGIGQSRTYALDAIRAFGRMNVPVIGTSITGELMSGPNFFRISPSNARQAQLAAAFAQSATLHARRVVVLANENEHISGKNLDLYSQDLADQFRHYFADARHSIIEVCHYGEQEKPEVFCPGQSRSLTISQLRDRICGENADLIFFAGRAVTLPQLFTTPGGTCGQLPPVLGSSDVPKYADTSALRLAIPKFGSKLYYVSFAPAKLGGCGTPVHRAFQTVSMCDFLGSYRAAQKIGGSQSAADNNAGLSYDSSDAMLGYDALQAVIQAIDASNGPDIDGAGVLRELDSGRIAFTGASGRISFSARNHAPPYHPAYVTLLGGTLTLQVSCGQFSDTAAGKGGYCPSVP